MTWRNGNDGELRQSVKLFFYRLGSSNLSSSTKIGVYISWLDSRSDKAKVAGSSPELRYSAIHGLTEDDEEYRDDDPVDLFSEIQNNLKEGTHFTSRCCENDKGGMYFYMYLYHADGRREFMNSNDMEDVLLKKMGIEEK